MQVTKASGTDALRWGVGSRAQGGGPGTEPGTSMLEGQEAEAVREAEERPEGPEGAEEVPGPGGGRVWRKKWAQPGWGPEA